MVHRYYCVYTYIYKYILDNTTLNSGHTVSFVTFTSYGFSVIEGTVRQRRVHQLCIDYSSITYTYHRAHWHDPYYKSGNTMRRKMVIPNTWRHASPTQPTDFSIHTHPPLGEGLIGRLHPRESGNIYLHDANQSVALHHARHRVRWPRGGAYERLTGTSRLNISNALTDKLFFSGAFPVVPKHVRVECFP